MILQCFHFTLAPFWQHFFYISETLGSKEHRRNLGKDKKNERWVQKQKDSWKVFRGGAVAVESWQHQPKGYTIKHYHNYQQYLRDGGVVVHLPFWVYHYYYHYTTRITLLHDLYIILVINIKYYILSILSIYHSIHYPYHLYIIVYYPPPLPRNILGYISLLQAPCIDHLRKSP
jgi:hypothetical protein